MPNERKINEVSSTPIIVTDIINMFNMYEPYITSWVTTNGPLLMKLAGALMAGYISLGMLKDMVLGIGSKEVSPEEKARMIEKEIKKLEQETRARYSRTNKKIVKEVYNHMKAENLLLEFDRRTVLRLIIEALSVEDIQAMANTKDNKSRRKLYRQLAKKYHPDKNPDNKDQAEIDFQDLTRLNNDPSIADVLLKKAQKAQGNEQSQTTQGDQKSQQSQATQADHKEPDPKVRQTLAQLAKKYSDKYNPLFQKFLQLIDTFKKEPAKFFEDQAFIDNLVKIAGSLNEEIDPEIQKELGLQPGKTKENLEKIVAGLEKIRQELLQALSKKGEESKNRPKEEPSNDQQKQLNENKEIYAKAKALLKREKSFYDEVNAAVDSYLKDNSDENIKKILTSFRKRKRFADFKENVEKIQDLMQTVEEQRKGAQTVVNKFRAGKGLSVSGFKDDIEAIGNYTQAYEALQQAIPSEKQDAKPLPLVPAAIEKIQGNELTIQTKDGNPITTVSKEEAKSTYDIISTADKFIRIYAVLLQYLAQKAPEEVQKVLPNKQLLQLTVSEPLVEPENYPLMITSGTPTPPEEEPEPKGEEPEEDEGKDLGIIGRDTFLDWYEDNSMSTLKEEKEEDKSKPKGKEWPLADKSLSDTLTDFNESFITTPLLQIQSMIFANLSNNLNLLRDPEFLKGFPSGSDTGGETKDQIDDQINEAEDYETIDIDQESLRTFRNEHRQLLRLARDLRNEVKKIDKPSDLETLGGSSIVRDSRRIAQELQEVLTRIYQTVEDSLASVLNEADQYQSELATRRSREERGRTIVSVYKKVKGYLMTIDQAVRNPENKKVGQIPVSSVLPPAQEALKELNTIRSFFPSFAPFGKNVKKPEKMIKELKRFTAGLVRDIQDILDQLSGIEGAAITEAAAKRQKNKEYLDVLKKMLKDASLEITKYFDVPSGIEGVNAAAPAKVTNMETAAAEGPGGNKAIKAGKAEDAERIPLEDQEASGAEKEINTANDAITSLKSSASDLNRTKEALAKNPGPAKSLSILNIKEFLIGTILYLNNFSEKQIKEELEDFNLDAGEENQKLDVQETPITKMMKLTKEKIIILNRLMANDKADIIEKFFGPLMKDKYAVTLLNKRLEAIKKKDPQSFNLSYKEAQQLIAKLSPKKAKDEKPKDKDFEAGEKFGEKIKSFFKEEKIEKQLEKIIEHYLNTGKL